MPSLETPVEPSRALQDPRGAPFLSPAAVRWASGAFAIALAASFLVPDLPSARGLRLAACALLAVALYSQRLRPKGTFRVFGWCAATLAAGWIATGKGAPGNPALALALLLGLFLKNALTPWVRSRSSPWLVSLAIAGILPLAVAFLAGWGAPARDTPFTRLDRAVYTWVEAWILLAGFRAAAELLRRWIRRASVRTKLIVSFGIFAVTPAILAFLYVALSAWVHAGNLRATAIVRQLAAGSAGRGLIQRAERGPNPASASDLAARLERERPVLADRGLAAVALERGRDGWRVADRFGGPDSLFTPAAAPTADSGRVVRGLALRAGRIWWVETALWPGGDAAARPGAAAGAGATARPAADSLALQTFEPVDTTRMNGLARALGCDALLATSQVMSSSGRELNLGDRTEKGVRRYRVAGGAVIITTDEMPSGASSDSAEADSLAATISFTLAGGGGYAGLSSLREIKGMLNSGATPECFLWTGSGWRRGTAMLLVRSSPLEAIALAGLGTGPFAAAMLLALILFALLFLLVEVVSLAVGSRVASYITRGAAGLRAAAAAIGGGDFSVRVRVPSEDELGELAASFNRMAAGLEEGQRAMLEREQMRRELALARRIQSRLLPPGPPSPPHLDVAASNQMSQEVGGDYYDFIPMGDGRLGVCIADVAGKGVAAALLMSSVKAALISSAAVETAPDRLVGRVNRLLEQSVEPGRFVTLFFASVDPASLRLEYVNAGHPAPMLLRVDGEVARLDRGGTILGVDADAVFESGSTTLRPGDLLALFTDGVTEARGEGDELFGDERIEALLRTARGRPAEEALGSLLESVRSFEGDRGQSDDVTAILVRVRDRA